MQQFPPFCCRYAAVQSISTKAILTTYFSSKITPLQNFMNLPPWVKELCSMLQIEKNAAYAAA